MTSRKQGETGFHAKAKLCIFNKNDIPNITLTINNFEITSKKTINVLGVIFDSKLQWHAQVENAIKKSDKAKYAISLIKRYFSRNELNCLLTSNYYSILYYNSDIIRKPLPIRGVIFEPIFTLLNSQDGVEIILYLGYLANVRKIMRVGLNNYLKLGKNLL